MPTISTTTAETPITWLDVAKHLSQIEPSSGIWKERPQGLLRASVDWTAAVFEVADAEFSREQFFDWLGELFPNRVERSPESAWFILDGPDHANRLDIDF